MAIRRGTRHRLLCRLTVAALVDGEVLKPGTSRFRKGEGDAPVVNALRRLVEQVVVGQYTSATELFKWVKDVRPDVAFNLTKHVDGDRQQECYICRLRDRPN